MITGLPGSGKTYFAKALAKSLKAIHINSDGTRKKLWRIPGYKAADKSEVYNIMFEMVSKNLAEGKTVVVDATFSLQNYRQPYYHMVQEKNIPLNIVQIEAEESTIAQRLKKKRSDSDADFTIYQKIKREYEDISREHLLLRSDKLSLEEMIMNSKDLILKTNKVKWQKHRSSS